MLSQGLRFLARWAMPISGGSVFTGLALPDLAAAIRPALEPAVVVLMTLAVSRLDWSRLRAYGRRPGLTVVVVAWLLLVTPILIWATGSLVGLAPPLLAAVVLNAGSAPLMSSVPFCQLLGLDAELALMALLAATLLLPVALPVTVFWLLGLEAAIAPADFLIRIALFIGLPLAAAWLLRRLVPAAWIDAQGRAIDGLMVIALVVIAVAIMDGVTARLIADPVHAAVTLAAAFAVSITLHLTGAAAFWSIGHRAGLSMGVTCGSRNLIILLVILGDAIGADFALYVALGQLPIYLMPVAIQPLVRRLMARGAA